MEENMLLLQDQVAIITGSGQGIGRAIALRMASFGAHIAVVDKDSATATVTAKDVINLGRQALALTCDVTRQADVERMVASTLRQFGKVDILVNNAGSIGNPTRKSCLEMTEDDWHVLLEWNLIQVFRCTKAVAKSMIEKKIKGSIINVTTIEAFRAHPGNTPYAAAKAGVISFTKTTALELAPYGIRVNALAPDATVTEGTLKRRPGYDKVIPTHIPLGRLGRADDHSGAAVFLSSSLSSWITGTVIHIDGGTFAASGWKLTPDQRWSTDGINGQLPFLHQGA